MPRNVHGEAMSLPARTVEYFAYYMVVVTITLVGFPSLPLELLSLPDEGHMWIRLMGSLVGFLTVYYLVCARNEVRVFFQISARMRMLVVPVYALFVALDWVSPWLVAAAIPDLLGGIWTEWALRRTA